MLRLAFFMWLLISAPALAQDDEADAGSNDTADEAPVDTEPADAEPANAEPADAEPADAEPVEDMGADSEPIDESVEPQQDEPVEDEPSDEMLDGDSVEAPDDLPNDEMGDEGSGLIYEDPEEVPMDDDDGDYQEPASNPLPLRAAPDDTVDEARPARDPATSTAATYGDRVRDQESGKKVLFGEHRIRLSLARPTFEDLDFYDKLYGDEKSYPMISADWFAWDWYATLGLSLRFGYYAATGFTADAVDDPNNVSNDDVVVNRDGPTALTLIPFQFVGTAEFTPFDGKWLVIDAWFGYERLYYQEARTIGGDDTAALMLLQDAEDDSDDDATPVNSGWSSGTTVGVSANILLNALDDRGARSLRSIGLGYIYLSPFMEIVTSVNDNDVPFGRSVVGVGFTFESVR